MRDQLIGCIPLDGMQLDYYLLVEETERETEHYGVKIEWEGGDCAAIAGITASQSRIEELLCLLQAGSVTPSTLWDVVEDWL